MPLFVLGALAGLGVAMPLGAIGVLLIREGVVARFRTAAAGALAVAMVDAGYCVIAVTTGSLAGAWIDTLGAAPALVSGLVLVALGIAGLARASNPSTAPVTPAVLSPIGAFLRFAGLTAINPATLLYFLALAATLTSTFRNDGGVWAFVAGVGVASVSWQLGLVGVGSILRGRLRPSGTRLLTTLGSAIVLMLGAAALVAAAFGCSEN